MLQKYVDTVQGEVNDLFQSSLPVEELNQAVSLIIQAEQQAKRVHVMGIGKPAYLAGYLASLLSSIGTPAYVLDGTEAVHGSSGQVKAGDIVIAISNSGETAELLYSAQTVQENGATLIGVSSSLSSSLSKLSEVALIVKVEQEGDSLNKPPRASIVKQLLLLQCLSILLQEEKQLDQQTYGKWHPAGMIGQTIGQSEKEGRKG